MSIYQKVRKVEKVFALLEKEVASFQRATGMHCVTGCGRCCFKPDITATPLEFLPLAWHLNAEGKALSFYEKLRENRDQAMCGLFNPVSQTGGYCGRYTSRGLICRLFGFTAARDKHGSPRLVTCRTIKETQPEEYSAGVEQSENGQVAFMRDYYFKLTCIDPDLGRKMIPVNEAMTQALEVVLSYYAYRKPRKSA